jgi:hypothetical protein
MEPKRCARFQISTAALLITQVLWDEKLCHWVSGYRYFKGQGVKEDFQDPLTLADEGAMFLSKWKDTITQ